MRSEIASWRCSTRPRKGLLAVQRRDQLTHAGDVEHATSGLRRRPDRDGATETGGTLCHLGDDRHSPGVDESASGQVDRRAIDRTVPRPGIAVAGIGHLDTNASRVFSNHEADARVWAVRPAVLNSIGHEFTDEHHDRLAETHIMVGDQLCGERSRCSRAVRHWLQCDRLNRTPPSTPSRVSSSDASVRSHPRRSRCARVPGAGFEPALHVSGRGVQGLRPGGIWPVASVECPVAWGRSPACPPRSLPCRAVLESPVHLVRTLIAIAMSGISRPHRPTRAGHGVRRRIGCPS